MNTRAASGEETSASGPERRPRGQDPRATYPEGSIALEAPGPRTMGGTALERQLLLAREPGDDSIPRFTRRSSWARVAVLGAALAILGGAGILFFVQVRGHWMARAGLLESELESALAAATKREDLHRRETAERDRAIEERRSENQSLAALAGKTLEELKTTLEDLRKTREENTGLEKELRAALRAQAPSLRDTLLEWLSPAKLVPASGPGGPDAPPSTPERADGEAR
jgi:hypothetical protein